MKETLPKETAAQKRRIQAGTEAITYAMIDLQDGPTEAEWAFILSRMLHEKMGERLKYARMGRKSGANE